ncbi:MAG: hypothetical protein HN929_10360 [Chloroflexi bacterium]|nr:hypothetical protein [Chloroflexota bacterium]
MARVLKIIPAYPYVEDRIDTFGSPVKYEDWVKCIDAIVESEQSVDPGIDMDILVYRMYKLGQKFAVGADVINQLDNTKIARGTMRCVELENTDNTGFKIVAHAVSKFHNDYDYIIFQEDDISILPTGNGYVKAVVKQIESVKGCIAFAPIKIKPQLHFGGFFGLVPMNQLYHIIERFPPLKLKTELEIIHWYVKYNRLAIGDIVEIEGYDNFPSNSGNLGHLYEPLEQFRVKGKQLYRVGI